MQKRILLQHEDIYIYIYIYKCYIYIYTSMYIHIIYIYIYICMHQYTHSMHIRTYVYLFSPCLQPPQPPCPLRGTVPRCGGSPRPPPLYSGRGGGKHSKNTQKCRQVCSEHVYRYIYIYIYIYMRIQFSLGIPIIPIILYSVTSLPTSILRTFRERMLSAYNGLCDATAQWLSQRWPRTPTLGQNWLFSERWSCGWGRLIYKAYHVGIGVMDFLSLL